MAIFLVTIPHQLETGSSKLSEVLARHAGHVHERIPAIFDGVAAFEHVIVPADHACEFINEAENAGFIIGFEPHT